MTCLELDKKRYERGLPSSRTSTTAKLGSLDSSSASICSESFCAVRRCRVDIVAILRVCVRKDVLSLPRNMEGVKNFET